VTVAVLGPGGVGGFVAGALARAGTDVTVVARPETADVLAAQGLTVESVRLGTFTVHPRAAASLDRPAGVLVVATKAPALAAALERVRDEPDLVVPLLNGIEHMGLLRERFGDRAVAATIRIAAERVATGRIVHTSPGVKVELAPPRNDVDAFLHTVRLAEIPAEVREGESDVLWSKLVRLNALACTTAAAGPIGHVRTHPRWRALLEGAVDETAAVARAEGADVDAGTVLGELAGLPPAQVGSLARDLEAGAPSELDAIPGAVLRAAARHGLACPSVETLVAEIRRRYPGA
jgi:2-dehydropantoate 2-reductase